MSVFRTCLSAVGRVWLVVINAALFAFACASIYAGARLLLLADAGVPLEHLLDGSGVSQAAAAIGLRGLAIFTLVTSSLYLITAISGCIGGWCAVHSFLSFYMAAVTIDLLSLFGLGGYGLYRVLSSHTSWASVTITDWTNASSQTKDFVQQSFGCCGFDPNDGLAYTGPSQSNNTNHCAQPTDSSSANVTYPSCHDAGFSFFTGVAFVLGIIMVSGTIVALISLGAANAARKKRALLERGFKAAGRTDVVATSRDKEPLMV